MKRILIFIIPLLFFCCKTDKSIEISKIKFEEKILIPGDLLKNHIYSDAVFSDPEIRIFVKPDSLHLPRHESVKNIKEGHQYSLKIVGYETFDR